MMKMIEWKAWWWEEARRNVAIRRFATSMINTLPSVDKILSSLTTSSNTDDNGSATDTFSDRIAVNDRGLVWLDRFDQQLTLCNQ